MTTEHKDALGTILFRYCNNVTYTNGIDVILSNGVSLVTNSYIDGEFEMEMFSVSNPDSGEGLVSANLEDIVSYVSTL